MRILMIPRIDTVDGTCSLSRLPVGFIRETLKSHEDSFFYLVLHEDFCDDKSWLCNYGITEEHHDRVEFVPLSASDVGSPRLVSYQRRLEYTVGPALRDKVRPFDIPGRYADVVITECFQSTHYLKTIMNGQYLRAYIPPIPIICWAHWNPTSEWARLGKSGLLNKVDWMSCVTGLVGADGVVFGATAQRDQTFKDLSEWFNAKQIKRFRDDWPVVEGGVEVSKIKYIESPDRPLTGVWTGYTTQDFDPCAPGLVRAGMMKHLGKVVLQFMGVKIGTEKPEEVENYEALDYVDIKPVLSHEDFIGMLSDSDLIATTVPGVWSIRVAEAMAAGCIPITTKFTKDSMRLPDDYPFIVPDGAGALDKISAFASYLSKEDILQKWRKYVHDFAVENFDIVKQSDKVYKYAHDILDSRVKSAKAGDMETQILNAIDGLDTIGHIELIEKIGPKFIKEKSESLFSHRFVKHCMFHLGFRDSGGEHPIYVRNR